MTIYFISRHAGAVEWAKQEGFAVDRQLTHLDVDLIQVNDWVLGTLPINLIAEVNARGGRYFHLTLDLPAARRGQELSAEDMRQLGTQLVEYTAQRVA
ncbi:MAG: CRISPR-associated protein Csx16 [Proteobacteria bacterium]|nr:MAG: CRISPR-associated protein Csx16 [Pseudomonadota bacterium]